MDNKDFENYNIDDDFDLLDVGNDKPSSNDNSIESYEDFAKRYADAPDDNDVDLSSNNSEGFDLNSISSDDF